MQPVLIKAYGNIYPGSLDLYAGLHKICKLAISSIQEDPIVILSNDLLRISFEGIYFPIDEVLSYLKESLTFDQQGKLDILNIEAWTLERYIFKNCKIEYHKSPLNNVLDYSGH